MPWILGATPGLTRKLPTEPTQFSCGQRQRQYSVFAAWHRTVQPLQFCQPFPYLVRVFCMWYQFQISFGLRDRGGIVVFLSEYISQQKMQLRKTRAHVQAFRLETALLSVFDLVELVICVRVIEISFGVV